MNAQLISLETYCDSLKHIQRSVVAENNTMMLVSSAVVLLVITIQQAVYGISRINKDKPTNSRFKREVTDEKQNHDLCKELGLNQLFKLKHKIELRLLKALKAVHQDKSIAKKNQDRKIRAIQLFRKEINETETLFFESHRSLKRILKGDYKSLRNLEETSKQRLEELKKATLEEEQEYNAILVAEKEEIAELKQKGHDNVSKSNTPIRKFIDKLLNDIALAADKLELQLDDDSFLKKYHAHNKNLGIETVLRLDEDDSKVSSDSSGVVMLIDSHNNQFVLSKPKDSTVTHIDSNLIRDVIYIVIFSLALSIPCSWFKLPNLFAYILTGVILGPSGINFLKVFRIFIALLTIKGASGEATTAHKLRFDVVKTTTLREQYLN